MAASEMDLPTKSGAISIGHKGHSLSNLSGIDASPSGPRQGGGKKLAVRIQMLDDSITMFQVQAKAIGKVLFEQVCRQLNLLEADYFGLEYQEQTTRTKYWLDLLKPLNRQVGLSLVEPLFRFCIKFYTPDPAQLEEEYTRYLFCLQIKRDLSTGSLQCNDNTAALMASYIVQASCGDFVPEDYPDHTYLSSHKFVPHQDILMQIKIMENHKKHAGQSPAEADMNLLETARRCELYGIKMHPAKDIEGVPLYLSVAHMGLAVFQGTTRINIFSWAKIRKISFKRKRFLIKLHPEGYSYYKDTVEFFFDGRNECKNFWKKCVENHGFFRCSSVKNPPRRKTRVLSRGSSFRYSGKTQKQIIAFVRENYVKRQNFQRSQSFRQGPLNASSRSQSHSHVNSSISANPLLPIDSALWDSRNPCNNSTTHFLTKKTMDTWGHRRDNLTDHMYSQETAAQAEIYQTKNYVPESPIIRAEHRRQSKMDMDQMNMPRSVSPLGQQLWSSPMHSQKDQDQAHVALNRDNLGLSQSSLTYKNGGPHRVSVGSQACVNVPLQKLQAKTNTNNFNQSRIHSADLSSSSEFKQDEKEIVLSKISKTSDLTTFTSSQENIFLLPGQSHHSEPAHYSSTNYLTSKQSSVNNNTSIETETDNLIYTDINEINDYKNPNEYESAVEHKISNKNNLNLIIGCDIYATVNRKTKFKSKINHISDKFLDESIKEYKSTEKNNLNDSLNQTYTSYLSNTRYSEAIFQKQYDSNEIFDSSSDSYANKENLQNAQFKSLTQFDHYVRPFEIQPLYCNTLPLPNKSEFSCENSLDSFDSHYKGYESYDKPEGMDDPSFYMYGNNQQHSQETNDSKLVSSIDSKTSSEKLDNEPSHGYLYAVPKIQQSETSSEFCMEKESWLKSSSCRDLLNESEESKPVISFVKGFLSYNRIDSPVTRYDDSGHSMYLNKNKSSNNFPNFSTILDSKVYSSSYPGSTRKNYNCFQHMRMYGNHLDYSGSQDDISHDSYELLEKNELFTKYIRSDDNIRSCSIDSGNFIPSDDEIASGYQKYRSAMDVKCKSVADIMNQIWDSEDPRYLPREKLSVKSDGSFYKKIREAQDSQSSSQESRSDIYEIKASCSSCGSKKSRDSLYHTDSKKSHEITKSKASGASSGASKESLVEDFLSRNYEMPMTTGKKIIKDSKINQYHQPSSAESKSDYYDAQEFFESDSLSGRPRVKSIGSLLSDIQGSVLKEFVCGNCDTSCTFPCSKTSKTSKVHSISLQNVKIEKNSKSFGNKSPDKIYSNKYQQDNITQASMSCGKRHDKECLTALAFRRKSDSENIFSFDRDKIEYFTSLKQSDKPPKDETKKNSPDYPLTPELLSEFDKQVQSCKIQKITRKEELIAKTHFEEYNPKVINSQATQLPNVLAPLTYSHASVERTKSDPNSLANRSTLCKNQRRHVLMHQKSIDLTPADSSDEDYFYKQIPSAPPQCKSFGNFEIPKIYNMLTNPSNEAKYGFETPKSFFHEFESSDSNAVKDEIPYVLHKRHVINGTISSPVEKKYQNPKSPKSPKSPKGSTPSKSKVPCSKKKSPDILDGLLPELRNIDPCAREVDNSLSKNEVMSPKHATSKEIDNKLMEKLNKKLSKIQTNSATASRTENIYKTSQGRNWEQKEPQLGQPFKKEMSSTKLAVAKRIISKPKTNKINKSKTRITSFSSDDESLDSDDVFGSTEPIPSTLEFSPPQSRKEIEPILQIEQSKLISAAWGRGQTMSSTEIEGSPPQCRRFTELESCKDNIKLELGINHKTTELRRISERSISIPSSEEENIVSNKGFCLSTGDYQLKENIPVPFIMPLDSVFDEEQPNAYENDGNDAMDAIKYTLKKNNCQKPSRSVILDLPFSSWTKENPSVVLPHVYLNLSEGSGLATLQKRKAAFESSLNNRRAKSLEIPVITMHKLPPINTFSSQDDTMEFEEEPDILEEKVLHHKISKLEKETSSSILSYGGSVSSAEVYHSALNQDPMLGVVNIDFEENDLLHQLAFIEKITLKGVKIKDRQKSKMELRSGDHLILDIPKYNFDYSPLNSYNASRKTSPGVSRASSLENTALKKSKARPKNSDSTKLKQNADNVTSNKNEKKNLSKEKLSKEKSKSQEENETDIAKRKERQQKLYESAMKQTITMLSPVMDKLPPFPTSQDTISVKTEGDKIIIETEFKSKAKDHVLIAKSPRKLDTSLLKFSRSFDEGGCIKKLEKANRSFEDRKKSFEDSEKSDTASDVAIESPKTARKNQTFEENNTYKKSLKPSNLEKKMIYKKSDLKNSEAESRSEEKADKFGAEVADRNMFGNNYFMNEEIDMQAVITERRSLEILKRLIPRSEDAKDSDGSHMPSTEGSIDSNVSMDRVPTIECEEPSLEDDKIINEGRDLKVSQQSACHLSLDRSRSDETGSWMTVECEEYIGSDISDNDPRTLQHDKDSLTKQRTLDDVADLNAKTSPSSSVIGNANSLLKKPLTKESDSKKSSFFAQPGEKSKSSDSCTSGEATGTSSKSDGERCDWSLSGNGKEKNSVDDESSISCSIARPLGFSQDFGELESLKCLELKEKMVKLDNESATRNKNLPQSETGAITKKDEQTPVLEKQSHVDFETGNEFYQSEFEESEIIKPQLPKDESSSVKAPQACKPVRKKISKNTALTQESVAKIGKSESDQSLQESKSSFESKGSFETETSSGSIEVAHNQEEPLQEDQESNIKFLSTENAAGFCMEETFPDYEPFDHIDNVLKSSPESEFMFKGLKDSSSESQNELLDFSSSFGYPVLTSSLSGIGINPTDIIGYSTGFATGRTLSRISERSTASEKSSIEDDVSKASTHSVSMRDESADSTDHQPSLSSDSRSNTNLAYISDADRRTSAEMPDIPCDSATGERLSSLSSLNGRKSSTVITGRFAVTQVDEQSAEEFDRHTLLCLSNPGSQDSEDWPLPEIPFDFVPVKPTELVFLVPDVGKPPPKTFSWKSEKSFESHDSQDHPSPTTNLEEYSLPEPYCTPTFKKTGETSAHFFDKTECITEDVHYAKTSNNFMQSPEDSKVLPYAETSYFMSNSFNNKKEFDDTCFSAVEYNPPTCLSTVSFLPYTLQDYCCSAFINASEKSLMNENISDGIIILQPTRSSKDLTFISEEEAIANDDVFLSDTTKIQHSPDESSGMKFGRKHSHCNLDASPDNILSVSGETFYDDQLTGRRGFDMHLSSGYRKCSHSSHSEEETSSVGTDHDGTVRMGLQMKKCTHSSHSEDTSIGLSISEWSTGTNTVQQYGNLSGSDSLSAVSNHSIGIKSDKSNHVKSNVSSFNKSSESLNEKLANFSASLNMPTDNGSSEGLRYDILSSYDTEKFSDSMSKSDESALTLTEMAKTVTEWSTSSSQTIRGQTRVQPAQDTKTRRGSYIEYKPLNNSRDMDSFTPPADKKQLFPKNSNSSSDIDTCQSEIVSLEKTDHFEPFHTADWKDRNVLVGAPKKQFSLDMMSRRYDRQEVFSDAEPFNQSLYPPTEKFSARYQSQEFFPLKQHSTESASSLELFSLKKRPINSFKYKSLSATEIRECKRKKIQHSHSFHELLFLGKSSKSEINQVPVPLIVPMAFTETIEPNIARNSTLPLVHRTVKSTRPSTFLSKSPASETFQSQIIEKPPRKAPLIRPRDTESSINLRKQEFRNKRPIPKKHNRSDCFYTEQEGIELSANFLPDYEVPKPSTSKQRQFTEKPDPKSGSFNDHHPYKKFAISKKGTSEDSSTSSHVSMPTAHKKSLKSLSHRSRQMSIDESNSTIVEYLEYQNLEFKPKESVSTQELSLPSIQHPDIIELPYCDFLSDYENEEADTDDTSNCGSPRVFPPRKFLNASKHK